MVTCATWISSALSSSEVGDNTGCLDKAFSYSITMYLVPLPGVLAIQIRYTQHSFDSDMVSIHCYILCGYANDIWNMKFTMQQPEFLAQL